MGKLIFQSLDEVITIARYTVPSGFRPPQEWCGWCGSRRRPASGAVLGGFRPE
ncbi:MAG: hypothetical protein NTU41_15035 [Chloroflexi bacterium]|nr:hypothetical protein [Chloroflexota bacterium]